MPSWSRRGIFGAIKAMTGYPLSRYSALILNMSLKSEISLLTSSCFDLAEFHFDIYDCSKEANVPTEDCLMARFKHSRATFHMSCGL